MYVVFPDGDDDDDANNAVSTTYYEAVDKMTEDSKINTFDIALEEKQQAHIFVEGHISTWGSMR